MPQLHIHLRMDTRDPARSVHVSRQSITRLVKTYLPSPTHPLHEGPPLPSRFCLNTSISKADVDFMFKRMKGRCGEECALSAEHPARAERGGSWVIGGSSSFPVSRGLRLLSSTLHPPGSPEFDTSSQPKTQLLGSSQRATGCGIRPWGKMKIVGEQRRD